MSDDEGSDSGEPQYQVVFEADADPAAKPAKFLAKDGKAAAKFANDDTYVGEYLGGKRHGKGVYTFANGARYEGEYVNGQKQGKGSFLTLDGGKYSGDWVADKREGQGVYVYANGDAYSGGWKADRKHGKGTYTYAKNGSSITGEWSNGQIMHGAWSMADGSRFTGAFHNNQPSGLGLHKFTNGSQATGSYSVDRKLGYRWTSSTPQISSATDAPPAAAPADPLKVASRFVAKCVLKADHFEGIYRLKKEVDGCPNLRKVADLPIFAMGQPTRAGLTAFAAWAGEQHSVDKFVWVNLRAEPVVYVNDASFIPRSKHTLNEPFTLGAGSPPLTPAQLGQVETLLVAKLSKDIAHRGNLHSFLRDTFAEHAQDRRNMELSEEVKIDAETGNFGNAIQTPEQVFTALQEDGGVDVEYKRLPIPSGRMPPPADIDALVQLLKGQEASVGLVLNDQMGRGRATLGSIIATLLRRTQDALAGAEERAENGSPLGRTDQDGLSLPAYDDADPNLRLGQYGLIMKLVRALGADNAALGNGDQLKAEVDDAVDRCKAMQNLREIVLFAKENFEREAASVGSGAAPSVTDADGSRQRFWLESAQNFVERYAYLLLFHAYVKANIESEFEAQTFAQFIDSKKAIIEATIGSRDSGALKEFRWQ